eukprot:CAMPEP_0196825552 /NCGR_PEP_ID=MMETSP1362-20130617/93117_1 /TAXON_ID=163516 /ORGANISM="Leptocylindrus danicus, Strain CCMP1856" /LENGTH=92 /DNA_ID=CAMNT_0042205993 /DNA_START=248 /DNA_END=527 /DNA_ORIENTATION=+
MDDDDIMTDDQVTDILNDDTIQADDEKLFDNKRKWDGPTSSGDSSPLVGEPLWKNWIIHRCLHAPASSLNGDVPAGHTATAFFMVLPNNDPN